MYILFFVGGGLKNENYYKGRYWQIISFCYGFCDMYCSNEEGYREKREIDYSKL